MTSLFYREKGNPELPPLILLHGLWGASDNWLPVAGLLSGRFHVILPDLRNHGNSPWNHCHNYEALSEDILYFIESLHLPVKPFIAGHSMGGKTTMVLILKQPEIISKAAILDIAPKTYPPAAQSTHLQRLDFMLSTPVEKISNRTTLHRMIRDCFPDEFEAQLLLKNIQRTPQGLKWKINATALRDALPDLLGWPSAGIPQQTPVPVLFVKGACSDYITNDDLPLIRKYFPSASLVTLPDASHYLHTSQPELLAETLSQFMSGDSSPTN